MKGLTRRQEEILSYISTSITDRGYPPTIREIGRFMGIRSTNGVNDHLKALERKGFLRRDDLKSRAMRPVARAVVDRVAAEVTGRGGGAAGVPASPGRERRAVAAQLKGDFVEVPLLGKVAAGAPILAVAEAEDTVRVDRFFIGNHREVYALRIVGESMIEDGILDGDYVFVQKAPTAQAGDIVIALIEDEATCKRYYPEGERIRFQPANARMEPIYVQRRDFRETMILGRVIGVYRKMC